MVEPIPIDCEGSGCPPCTAGFTAKDGQVKGLCQMCGHWFPFADDAVLVDHERDDILARLQRGDFG